MLLKLSTGASKIPQKDPKTAGTASSTVIFVLDGAIIGEHRDNYRPERVKEADVALTFHTERRRLFIRQPAGDYVVKPCEIDITV